jgi:ribosomal-protein-alanine N-acetyltransferase
MLIRKWKYEDILTISQLERECFKGECWSYSTLASCFENPAFYGLAVEDGGEIIGYGGITVAADTSDLENILITEPYRRCGLGNKLLKELLDLAQKKGAEKTFLEVRVSNSPAMCMYLKNGFVGTYARTRYYSDGEDCLVMCKKLQGN